MAVAGSTGGEKLKLWTPTTSNYCSSPNNTILPAVLASSYNIILFI